MLFDAQNKEIVYRGPDWIKDELAPYNPKPTTMSGKPSLIRSRIT